MIFLRWRICTALWRVSISVSPHHYSFLSLLIEDKSLDWVVPFELFFAHTIYPGSSASHCIISSIIRKAQTRISRNTLCILHHKIRVFTQKHSNLSKMTIPHHHCVRYCDVSSDRLSEKEKSRSSNWRFPRRPSVQATLLFHLIAPYS